MITTIKFYRTSDESGCFSNFVNYPIKLKGKVWPTSEHFFQAQKFSGTPDEEEIRFAKNAMEAARKGRERNRKLRRDWEKQKVNIMRQALEAKFTQHNELKELLLSTGEAKLVEHTKNDNFWGDGGDGSGRNMLGILLMQVREWLKETESKFLIIAK